jgi:hypothetical protein
MSEDIARLFNEISARLDVLRAMVNVEAVPDIQVPAPEPLPVAPMNRMLDDDNIRVLWAVATFLGSGKAPTCIGMYEVLRMSQSQVGKQLQKLETQGLVARQAKHGSIVRITKAGKELLQFLEPAPKWQR